MVATAINYIKEEMMIKDDVLDHLGISKDELDRAASSMGFSKDKVEYSASDINLLKSYIAKSDQAAKERYERDKGKDQEIPETPPVPERKLQNKRGVKVMAKLPPIEKRDFFTVPEAAEILGKTKQYISVLSGSKKLEKVGHGKVSKSSVYAYKNGLGAQSQNKPDVTPPPQPPAEPQTNESAKPPRNDKKRGVQQKRFDDVKAAADTYNEGNMNGSQHQGMEVIEKRIIRFHVDLLEDGTHAVTFVLNKADVIPSLVHTIFSLIDVANEKASDRMELGK